MFGGHLALVGTAQPNKSVKGTRRPLAVLEFSFYQGSVASFAFASSAPLTVTLGFWGERCRVRFVFVGFGAGGQFFGLLRAAVFHLQFGFCFCLIWL